MLATIHLRAGPNKTNVRCEALIPALESAGVDVRIMSRADAPKDSDLVIQTGFGASEALKAQIEANRPYLIMEEPYWRDFFTSPASSWNYNGLAGGAWAPEPPEEERPKPELLPMKESGSRTLIIGQKPTDHSLRGHDHVRWILETKAEIPLADFRPHPLMAREGALIPLRDALLEYDQVVTFTSTAASEALVVGCQIRADHRCSLAYGVDGDSREAWHHATSWRHAPNNRIGDLVPHILSGYDEARARAEQGLVEHPREKVDGRAICERYYRELRESGLQTLA